MLSSEADEGGSYPLAPVERFYSLSGQRVRTCCGLHLLFAGAATGKSLLTVSWAKAIDEPVTWHYVNEPGGKFFKPEVLKPKIVASKRTFVLVDSLSLYFLALGGAGGGAAMRGGMTLGLIDAITELDQAARDANKVVVGIVNTSIMPIVVDDAMVHGLLSVDIGARTIRWRDRTSGRLDTELVLSEEQLQKGCEALGYKAPPPARAANPVDADVAAKGHKPVPVSEKRL